MESRDDQRRGGGNPAPATTYIILSRSGAGYLGSYTISNICCFLDLVAGDENSIPNDRHRHQAASTISTQYSAIDQDVGGNAAVASSMRPMKTSTGSGKLAGRVWV